MKRHVFVFQWITVSFGYKYNRFFPSSGLEHSQKGNLEDSLYFQIPVIEEDLKNWLK